MSGSWSTQSGLYINTTGCLSLSCGSLRVGHSVDSTHSATILVPYEQTVSISYAKNAWETGDGYIEIEMDRLDMLFIQGMLVDFNIERVR